MAAYEVLLTVRITSAQSINALPDETEYTGNETNDTKGSEIEYDWKQSLFTQSLAVGKNSREKSDPIEQRVAEDGVNHRMNYRMNYKYRARENHVEYGVYRLYSVEWMARCS